MALEKIDDIMDNIKDYIVKIIREIEGSKVCVHDTTRLYQDLGMHGDDMHDLLIALQKRFGTSFVDMDFERYCPNEVDGFYEHILEKFGLGKKWPPLTVAHLAQVVKSGSWFDP